MIIMAYNFKSKIVKTYIDCIIKLIFTIHQNKLKKVFIASKMLNILYLMHKHINLKFGPIKRAVKLHKV